MHEWYGFGTVLLCDEEGISILFDGHGEMKFARSIVALEKGDREPPPGRENSRSRQPHPLPSRNITRRAGEEV